MYGGSRCSVFAHFLVLCTEGTSMLLYWPSAWNEKCLMPLVCLEGLSLFPKMDSHALLIRKHSCNAISSFKHSWLWIGALFIYLFYQIHFVLSARLVDWLHDFVGVMLSPSFCPLSHPPFPPTPSGRLNGSYAETTPSSPHPSAQYADRESHKTKDKGRQRHTNVEQWQGEIHSNGYNTDSVTSNGTYLTLCWALCCGRTHICVYPVCLHLTAYVLYILYSNTCLLLSDFSVSTCSTCVILHDLHVVNNISLWFSLILALYSSMSITDYCEMVNIHLLTSYLYSKFVPVSSFAAATWHIHIIKGSLCSVCNTSWICTVKH